MATKLYTFQFIQGGERATHKELQKMQYQDTYLWGDVFYHLYKREDGKIFAQSEWLGNTTGREGYWIPKG